VCGSGKWLIRSAGARGKAGHAGYRAAPEIASLKELRPGSRERSEVRILFVFDPWRSAILLVAG